MTDTYRDTIKELSDRIVEAQRPIKVLNAINWDDSIKDKFFASDFKELPAIDHAYYEARDTKLDPDATRNELRGIEADLQAKLGPVSPAGNLMKFMCEQFRLTVDMLDATGTPGFSQIASLLYGTPHDVFHVGGPTIADLAQQMRKVLQGLDVQSETEKDLRNIPGTEAVGILQTSVDASMGKGMVEVRRATGSRPTLPAGAATTRVGENPMYPNANSNTSTKFAPSLAARIPSMRCISLASRRG